jgi:hypothetical protein
MSDECELNCRILLGILDGIQIAIAATRNKGMLVFNYSWVPADILRLPYNRWHLNRSVSKHIDSSQLDVMNMVACSDHSLSQLKSTVRQLELQKLVLTEIQKLKQGVTVTKVIQDWDELVGDLNALISLVGAMDSVCYYPRLRLREAVRRYKDASCDTTPGDVHLKRLQLEHQRTNFTKAINSVLEKFIGDNFDFDGYNATFNKHTQKIQLASVSARTHIIDLNQSMCDLPNRSCAKAKPHSHTGRGAPPREDTRHSSSNQEVLHLSTEGTRTQNTTRTTNKRTSDSSDSRTLDLGVGDITSLLSSQWVLDK